MGVQTLPTGIFGPLPTKTWGFIIGRCSSIVDGLQIYPGAIDRDYQGEIKIMASSPKGVITVPAYQKIAQLILVPLYPMLSSPVNIEEGQSCFDSSDVYWVQSITN